MIPVAAVIAICAVLGLFGVLVFVTASTPAERPVTVDRDKVYEEGA